MTGHPHGEHSNLQRGLAQCVNDASAVGASRMVCLEAAISSVPCPLCGAALTAPKRGSYSRHTRSQVNPAMQPLAGSGKRQALASACTGPAVPLKTLANCPQFLSGLTGAALVKWLYFSACSASRVRDQALATWQFFLMA